MHGRTHAALAAAVVAIIACAACVDIPDGMRAQFAPAGPNERTNYVPGRHGSAPPNDPPPMLPWDAGAPVLDAGAAPEAGPASAVDAGAAPVSTPVGDGGVV